MGMTTKAFTATVDGIPAARLPDVIETVRPFLNRLERHDKDGMTAGEYEAEIFERRMQLWRLGDWEAIALTRITREAVRLEWVVGKNRTVWQDVLDEELRKWGRSLGKKRLIVMARPGWASLAKKRGFRELQRAYEARL